MSIRDRTAVVMGTGRLKDLVAWGLKSMGVGNVITDIKDKIEGDIIVLAGGATQCEAERINTVSRSLGVPFVWADVCASSGFVFDDFGESYTVNSNSNEKVLVVTGVTQDEAGGVVTIDDNDKVWCNVKVGYTRVTFSGMRSEGELGEALEKKVDGHLVTEVIGEHAFRIETDTSHNTPFSGCGYVTVVPTPITFQSTLLGDSLRENKIAASTVLSVLNCDCASRSSLADELIISGIACNEAMKGLTGVFTPTPGQWILQNFSAPSANVSLAGMKILAFCQDSQPYTRNVILEFLSLMGCNKCDLFFDDKIGEDIFENLDICFAINPDISAVQQLADRCVSHEKPLFVASATGTKGYFQAVIPHKTAAFDASRHQTKHEDYPLCVLQNFPYRPEHTVSWAYSKLNDIIATPEKSTSVSLFDSFFYSEIEKLSSSCQDTLWTGLKRKPRPIKYDKEIIEHLAFTDAAEKILQGDHSKKTCKEFVSAAACLRAENYGIPKPLFDNEDATLWSSLSIATGLVFEEVLKFVEGNNNHEACYNAINASFDINRKDNVIQTFSPQPPLPVEQGSPWTVWDYAKVSGEEMTFFDLVKSLKKVYHGTVTAVIYLGRTILITKKNKKTRIIEVLETATKTSNTFGNGVPFITFDVIAEDADGEDVDIPRVRYYPK